MTSTGSSFFDPCKSIAAVTEVVITTTQKIILKKWKGKKKMRPVMHTKADSSQHISSMYERTTHSSARYWVSYMLTCIDQTWCIQCYSYTIIYVSQCSSKKQNLMYLLKLYQIKCIFNKQYLLKWYHEKLLILQKVSKANKTTEGENFWASEPEPVV